MLAAAQLKIKLKMKSCCFSAKWYFLDSWEEKLLYRYRFSQIPGLIYITATHNRNMVRKQL